MSQKSRSQEYARAVYELALEGWQKDLQAIQEKLSASPDLMKQLQDAGIDFATRQKALDGILPEDLSTQRRNFFYTLLKNGHLDIVQEIGANLTRLATKGPGVEIATVTTALELPEKDQESFRTKLVSQYGEHVDVEFNVDESILGGVIVQVGDKIIDGSLISKLNSAQQTLTAI